MGAESEIAQELKSLQNELSASGKERTAATVTPPRPAPVDESAEQSELRDQLHDLAREVTHYFEEAENSISAHPAESVVSALVVGILIGRLLGRR